MNLKSICASIVSFLVLAVIPVSSYNTNAIQANVKLGDANNDGVVNISDSVCIIQYLSGRYSASQYCFTAMDINDDKVIDKTDAYIIQNRSLNNITTVETETKELYKLPDNNGRYYKKYNCSTRSTYMYYLSAASALNLNVSLYSENSLPSDIADHENMNVVRLLMSDGSSGSGFVIDEHTIATAAHCVYSGQNFVSGVTVNIYNQNAQATSENLIASFNADSYHIPNFYITQSESTRYNYDYALIHVGDDANGNNLLDYVSPWNLGIASIDFSEDESGLITSSGFTSHNGVIQRYYSTGNVVDFSILPNETHNNPNFRIASLGASYSGKSGGAMYYKSSYQSTEFKSIVGIITSGNGSTIGTWGTRITPTVIRFYKQNPNI